MNKFFNSFRSKPLLDVYIWAFILIVILILQSIHIPEILKAFLALPLLVIIPFSFGKLVIRIVGDSLLEYSLESDDLSDWIISWLIGGYILTIIALVLQMFSLTLVVKNMHWIIVSVGTICMIYSVIKNIYSSQTYRISNLPSALQDGKIILFVGIIGLIPVFIDKYFGPFPSIRSGFARPKIIVQPVLRMIEDGFITWSLPTHKSATTVLLAEISALVNVEPLSILWSGPFLLYVIFALGFYLWAHEVSQNKLMSVMVVIFGVFIMAGAPSFQGIPLRLRSSTVQYALLPMLLFLIHKNIGERDFRLGDLALVLALSSVTIVAFFITVNLDRWVSIFSISNRTQAHTLLTIVFVRPQT